MAEATAQAELANGANRHQHLHNSVIMLPHLHTFQATWGSHSLSPLSKEKSQGLSESVSPFLLEGPLQVLTACYRFSYYLTIFNLFPSSLLQIKWPSDFIDVELGLELILTKVTGVEMRESSPLEPLSLCHELPLPGSLPLDLPSLKGTWRRPSA